MLSATALLPLVMSCAPLIAPQTAQALIAVESAGNPYAIGVVGGALVRQPSSRAQALATIEALESAGWNYSVGLGQINKRNFQRLHLTPATALEPCANLAAMQGILGECFRGASRRQVQVNGGPAERTSGLDADRRQVALRDAFSCYYSGNFVAGHRLGYVARVVAAWRTAVSRTDQTQLR